MTGIGELEPVIRVNNEITAGHVDKGLRIFFRDSGKSFHDFRHGSVETDLRLQATFGHRCEHR